jgi:hypothetical protein
MVGYDRMGPLGTMGQPLLFRGGVARLTNVFVSRSGVVLAGEGARAAPTTPFD